MTPDARLTRTPSSESNDASSPPTGTFDPALDAGLAVAFGSDPELTPAGWSHSAERATNMSAQPSAPTISVALGSREQTRRRSA